MDLAYAAGRAGGTMTGVLSAANEKAVEMFIDEKYVCLPWPHLMFLEFSAKKLKFPTCLELHVAGCLIWFNAWPSMCYLRFLTKSFTTYGEK